MEYETRWKDSNTHVNKPTQDKANQVDGVVRCDRPSPCAKDCEAQAFYIEIRRLKGVMINVAADLAKELHTDDITPAQDRRLYSLIQKLKGYGHEVG